MQGLRRAASGAKDKSVKDKKGAYRPTPRIGSRRPSATTDDVTQNGSEDYSPKGPTARNMLSADDVSGGRAGTGARVEECAGKIRWGRRAKCDP